MHYHVIENVPGYLPMSDDPYIVETFAEARDAIAEIVEGWREERAELAHDFEAFGTLSADPDGETKCARCGRTVATHADETETIGLADDELGAWMTDRSDYSHDLGIVASAEPCHESDCVEER